MSDVNPQSFAGDTQQPDPDRQREVDARTAPILEGVGPEPTADELTAEQREAVHERILAGLPPVPLPPE